MRRKTMTNQRETTGQGRSGAPSGRAVEAEQFVVKDASGNVRAQLGCDRSGNPLLQIIDADGRLRIAIGVYEGTPGVRLFDREHQARVELSVVAEGDAVALSLNDGAGTRRVKVACAGDSSEVQLLDAVGVLRVLACVEPEEGSVVLLYDLDGREGAALVVPEGEEGQLDLSGPSGMLQQF